MLEIERGIARQAIADWRDRQIIDAAALINRAGSEARQAYETDLETTVLSESLFGAVQSAAARTDELMEAALREPLRVFLVIAASELAEINARLAPIGEAIVRDDAISFPSARIQPPAVEDEPLSEVSAGQANPADASVEARRGSGWLNRLSERVATGATTLAASTASAADTLVQDGLGLRGRMRKVAAERIETAWIGTAGEPRPLLAKLIALIDEAAFQARTSL